MANGTSSPSSSAPVAGVVDHRIDSFDSLLSVTFLHLQDQFPGPVRAHVQARTLDHFLLVADLQRAVDKAPNQAAVVATVSRLVRPLVRDYTLDMLVLTLPVKDHPDQALVVHSDGENAGATLFTLAQGEDGPELVQHDMLPGKRVVDPAKYAPLDLIAEHVQQRNDPRAMLRSHARWLLRQKADRRGQVDAAPADTAKLEGARRLRTDPAWRALFVLQNGASQTLVPLGPIPARLSSATLETIARELANRAGSTSAALALRTPDGKLAVLSQNPIMHTADQYTLDDNGGIQAREGYYGANPLGFLALAAD